MTELQNDVQGDTGTEMTGLASLAMFAVANNNAKTARTYTRAWDLSIEKARAKCIVRDGNKNPSEDGSIAIVIGFSKRTLPLTKIKKNATRVNATAEQADQFLALLQAEVDKGTFDEEIITAQGLLKVADEERKAAQLAKGEEVTEDAEVSTENAPAEVDLGALDA